MRLVALLALAVLAITCGPSPDAKLPSYAQLAGGTTSASGGSGGRGGGTTVDSGGTTTRGDGGAAGAASGGRGGGAGGVVDTGGTREVTGGRTSGTGGRTSGTDAGADIRNDAGRGTGGQPGSGGTTVVVPDAGRGGSGGSTSAGRDAGRDVTAGGTGGIIPGSGGRTSGAGGGGGSTSRDASPTKSDVATSGCMATVVANDYACGSAAACSACKVNGVSKEDGCKKGVDCLAAAGANCDNNCQLSCYNQAGDQPVIDCVKALQTACASGC
jgi:hypothetical protein